MARFLGDSSGRTTSTYVDTQVNSACSSLCTYVNTDKLACTGCGTRVTGIVTSITSGTGISVDQSTGNVTISASGGGAPVVLYNCACCWNGSATIPVGTRGAYTHYEIIGNTQFYTYYCSQAAFCFAPWSGCSASNYATYCCAHCACGWVGDIKCFPSSYQYACAGAIAWPFGCGSGCLTACANYGFQYRAMISPENPCSGGDRGFKYCFATTMLGTGMCCIGMRNSGYAYPCCGMHSACLRGVCFSTPSASNPFNCNSSVTIIGYGRLV